MWPVCTFNLNGSCLYVSLPRSSFYLCIIYICFQNGSFLWLYVCSACLSVWAYVWFLLFVVVFFIFCLFCFFIIYEHIKKYLFIFMQQQFAAKNGIQIIWREEMQGKYFSTSPAHICSDFFEQPFCQCVCEEEMHV